MEALREQFICARLLKLNNVEQVRLKIREQRDEILEGIATGHIKPDKQLIDYLGELNVAVGDVEVKS
jgi:hypothetical protein